MVEDDPDLRELFCEAIAHAGYSVQGAENGLAALSALDHLEHPCLILLDLMMPVMDGWELLRELDRRGRRDVYTIVVISAVADSAAPKGVALIPKPVTVQQLIDALNTHCGNVR